MKRAVVLIAVLFLVGGLLSNVLPARATSPQQEADTRDGVSPVSVAAPNTGPEADDEHFVADTGGDLDQYLFREDVADGRLRFQIPITRYYSGKITSDTVDAQGFLKSTTRKELIDGHILPNIARLRLRVFDVDEEAPDCPEVDRIYVNGKQVLRSGSPVKLSGANDTWSTPSFEVPIELFKFPTAKGSNGGAPTPAINEVAVAINVNNCQHRPEKTDWAVQVDWGVIEIPSPVRPILFAHGWTGAPSTFDRFEAFALADGIPVAGKPELLRGIQPIAQTSPVLVAAIYIATREFGVDKINVFAHSKGGLVTRHALRNAGVAEKVDYLITFGSPHHGTDWITTVANLNCGKGAFPNQADRDACWASARELTVGAIRDNFNYEGCTKGRWPWSGYTDCRPRYVQQPDVQYLSIVGGAGDIGAKNATFPWDADAIPFPNNADVAAQFGNNFNHTNINSAQEPYRCAISLIDNRIYGRDNCPASVSAVNSSLSEGVVGPIWPDEEYQLVDETSGNLEASARTTRTVTMDSAMQVLFNVVVSNELSSFSLRDPAGHAITPATPGLVYSVQQSDLLGWWYQYSIPTPDAGIWTLEITAAEDANYSSNVMAHSDSILSLATDKRTYAPGKLVTVEAALVKGTTPLAGTTITLTVTHPDGTTLSILAVDDGTHGDQGADDNVYAGQFDSSSVIGRHTLSAEAIRGQTRRSEETYFDVTRQTARIASVVSELPADTNGNSLYDELNIRVALQVAEPGNFEVLCSLIDSQGNTVASASFATLRDGTGPLTVGLHELPLTFSGSTIRSHAVDGPYTLTYVIVEDQTRIPVEVQSVENVYTTAPYRATEFEGNLVSLTATNDILIDSDGNGVNDILRINFVVSVVNMGTYELNGRLVDANGDEIAWASASFDASDSGAYEVYLDFEGQTIGQRCVGGPYTLQDLSVFNTSGPGSAIFNQAHTTQAYSHTVFEGASSCSRPDLIVQEVQATENIVQIAIKNQGTAAIPAENGFWVDMYIDPSMPPTKPNEIWNFLANEGLVWGVDGDVLPMEPGEVITLTLGDALYWPDLSKFSGSLPPGTPVYVQVDSANTNTTYGGVLESHEASGGAYNNVAGPIPVEAAAARQTFYLPLLTTEGTAGAAEVSEPTGEPEPEIHMLPSRVQPGTEN